MQQVNKKIYKIKDINDPDSAKDDFKFWLTKTPEERISAVELLRRQRHGNTARLQRVVNIIKRS